ncbi:hypothetical protein [Saccharibacter floricola]|uniref:hypothetical protein n=1 Tax=Saccharibacter floricola TaxID=231053 RepID=UPI0012E9AB49|nr:hypothetical protein [Saccharibacter floricola]
MVSSSKRPSTVPPPQNSTTSPQARVSTVPVPSRAEPSPTSEAAPRPSTVAVPPPPTDRTVTEASVTAPLRTRLSPSELSCPDYEKTILLSITLNHTHSIRAIGRQEEEAYRLISHWIATIDLQERDEFAALSEHITLLADGWNQPRKRNRLLKDRPLDVYLRDYSQRIIALQEKLTQQDRAFAEKYAKIQANAHTLERLIAALQQGHTLFQKKLPPHDNHLLTPLAERCTVLSTLLNDTLLQQSQLDNHRQGIHRELEGCDRILTFLITQIEQLSTQTTILAQEKDAHFFSKIKEFLSR